MLVLERILKGIIVSFLAKLTYRTFFKKLSRIIRLQDLIDFAYNYFQ